LVLFVPVLCPPSRSPAHTSAIACSQQQQLWDSVRAQLRDWPFFKRLHLSSQQKQARDKRDCKICRRSSRCKANEWSRLLSTMEQLQCTKGAGYEVRVYLGAANCNSFFR